MKTKRVGKSAAEIFGILMIGEGVVGAICPRRYPLFWKMGPKWHRHLVEMFAEHAETTRLICLAEIAAGLWLALRQIDE